MLAGFSPSSCALDNNSTSFAMSLAGSKGRRNYEKDVFFVAAAHPSWHKKCPSPWKEGALGGLCIPCTCSHAHPIADAAQTLGRGDTGKRVGMN